MERNLHPVRLSHLHAPLAVDINDIPTKQV